MAVQGEPVAHNELVGGGQTSKHSHSGGGGGPIIKAGMLFGTADDTWFAVVFGTAFATVPKVAVSAEKDATSRWDFNPIVRNVTVNGFDVRYDDRNASGSVNLHWIATDAGNS